ncbi:unnamed protein product [Amoebophrya sp. A25]|nr:unnamed protein product [Amoebophrya sp. A25]|eukprot:GSA25T00022924001.1
MKLMRQTGEELSSPSDGIPEKQCACTGIRQCAHCSDPKLRALWRLHPPRDWSDNIDLALRLDWSTRLARPIIREGVDVVEAETSYTLKDLGLDDNLRLWHDFVCQEEQDELLGVLHQEESDRFGWAASQSGRRKLDYGPKINYKYEKIVVKSFGCPPQQLRETKAFKKLQELFQECESCASRSSREDESTSTSSFSTSSVYASKTTSREQHLKDCLMASLTGNLPPTSSTLPTCSDGEERAQHVPDHAIAASSSSSSTSPISTSTTRSKAPLLPSLCRTGTFSELEPYPFRPAGWFFQGYEADAGSNFDPHIDHGWIWGDRIYDLNLISDSVLTFFSPPMIVLPEQHQLPQEAESESKKVRIRLDVPLPKRALLVFCGSSRYEWEHAVLPGTFGKGARVSLTVRELQWNWQETVLGQTCLTLANECSQEEQRAFKLELDEKERDEHEECRDAPKNRVQRKGRKMPPPRQGQHFLTSFNDDMMMKVKVTSNGGA